MNRFTYFLFLGIGLIFHLIACAPNQTENLPQAEELKEDSGFYQKIKRYKDSLNELVPLGAPIVFSIDTIPLLPPKISQDIVYSEPIFDHQYKTAEMVLVSDSMHFEPVLFSSKELEIEPIVRELVLPTPIQTKLSKNRSGNLGLNVLSSYEGLSSSSVRNVFFGKDNEMWIITDAGISLFDGEFLWNFDDDSEYSIIGSYGKGGFIDQKNRKWFYNREHLVLIDGQNMQSFPLKISMLSEDTLGNIWMTTANSDSLELYSYQENGRFTKYTLQTGKQNYLHSIKGLSDGSIWISSRKALIQVKENNIRQLFKGKKPMTGNAISKDHSGRTYISNYTNFYELKEKELYQIKLEIENHMIYSSLVDSKNKLWLSVWDKGLIEFFDGRYRLYSQQDGFPSNLFWETSLSKDKQLCISNLSGLSLMGVEGIQNIPAQGGHWGSFLAITDSLSYLSAFRGKIYEIKNGTLRSIETLNGRTPVHSSLAVGEDFSLWISSGFNESGDILHGDVFFKIKGDTLYEYKKPKGVNLPNNYLGSFLSFSNGVKCFNYLRKPLLLDANNFYVLNLAESLNGHVGENRVYEIGEKDVLNGNYWAYSFDFGLGRINGNEVAWFLPDSFELQKIKYKNIDTETPFFVTKDNVIYTFSKNAFYKRKSLNLVPKNSKISYLDSSITVAFRGDNIWLQKGNELLEFSNEHGLIETNITSIEYKNDSILLVIGDDYCSSLNLNLLYRKTQSAWPKLKLNGLFINKELFNNSSPYEYEADEKEFFLVPNSITLPYNKNHLIFQFAANDWKFPKSIVYSHRLIGSDEQWSTPSKDIKAIYNNLDPGNYVFEVKAINVGGTISETKSINIYINKPWWTRWWAILIYVLFGIAIVREIINKRTKKLKNRQVELEEKINHATQEIRQQHNEIIDSINYAKRIQNAILPPDKIFKKLLPNSFVLYKPKDIIAGDFYWLEQKDKVVLFAAADCTGHGVPGAMVSVICNNGLNRSVREHGILEPGKILDKTREIVIQEFEKSEEEVQDGMDIALCSIEGYQLKYAGAHNPLWIIRSGEIIETKADKEPIGKYENPSPYTTHSFELEKNDRIYLFSDGYVDQFGGAAGKKYKSLNFKKFLLSIQEHNMDKQKELLDAELENWKGDLEQIDDICVIGVSIN